MQHYMKYLWVLPYVRLTMTTIDMTEHRSTFMKNMSIKFLILCKFSSNNCNRRKQAQTLLNTVLEVSQFLQIIPEKNYY